MFKKGLLVGLLTILSMIVFGFTAGNHLVHADEPDYTISTDATYPPFDFQDKNNQI